ncbi:hypothetical protein VNO80_03454 [Phaseolus coccineus]|uniref:B-like cyclin n=1 Tax=Phaseolus coccineus TaxID=3886 RepID=A0AAN9RRP9_PHACN
MASRITVKQQGTDEAVVERGKQQKKKGVANGRNRKALGDIGNLANVGEVEVKPNRPITRSFGALLLANAQAEAAAAADKNKNNKKLVSANVARPPPVSNAVAVTKRAVHKRGQKKVTVKPKPEKVIDKEAIPDKEIQKDKKREGDDNSKKETHAFTSVLTARSKAACGITNKPKEQIIDIDAGDVDNEFAAVEYIDDLYRFYKLFENENRPHDYIDSQPIKERSRAILVNWLIEVNTKFDLSLETLYLTINIIDRFLSVKSIPSRRELQLVGISAMLMASKYEEIWAPQNENRPHDYIDSQPIKERSRAILVNWLIEVNTKFDLSLETLYLTINIIDRFLSVKSIPSRRELQLVGISAMLMASKYEEIWAPQVEDFVCLTTYTHEQILVMEKTILGNLEWTLTVPTPLVFLVRFIKATVPEQELENMAHFLSELGLVHYATVMYCPSMVAASAVFAARCTLNKTPLWNETLKLHTGYSIEQLMECARLLVRFHSMVGNEELKVVYRKYSDPQKGAVAMLPPAKNLLSEGFVPQ